MKLDEVLGDSEIISRFSSMVCIKLENGSQTCSQFAAIYPVIIVPSVYFIGDVIITSNSKPPPVVVTIHYYMSLDHQKITTGCFRITLKK